MNAQQFIVALRQIEEHGNCDPMVGLFGDQSRLWSAELDQPLIGQRGASRFWQTYKDTFTEIHSDFETIVEGKNRAALEWESHGTLAAGQQPFRYRGVSILEWSNSTITRFAAYFNPEDLTVTESRISEQRKAA